MVAAHSRYRACSHFGVCFSRISRHKGTHAIIRSAGVLLSCSRISHDFSLQDHPAQIREEKRTCNDSLSAIGLTDLLRSYSSRIQKYPHRDDDCKERGESGKTPAQRFPPARRHDVRVRGFPFSEFLILDFGKDKIENTFQAEYE